MFETIFAFLSENSVVIGSAGGLVGIAVVVWAVIKSPFSLFRKARPVKLDEETIEQIAPRKSPGGPELTVVDFIRIRREMKADLEAELSQAHADEKEQLRARIAELESQIANPEKALEEARTRIRELEARLERMGNEIGAEKLEEARAALERFDYSLADALFAEVEERQKLEVQQAARAAFGRGEIAEAEVRWADAAAHYARAARLDPSFAALKKAHEFAWRSGDYPAALNRGEELLALSREKGEETRLATALNEHALSLHATGRYAEAEPFYREAMAITEKTLGKEHPDYATSLNNLAELLRVTGRYAESEPLYREAMAIDKKALGKEHPGYATDLNNLATLLEATGRYEEAEPLFREAMATRKKALDNEHPEYAQSLNNLAGLLEATGCYSEAESLYRGAMAIFGKALGKEHPDYATSLNNLAVLYYCMKHFDKALPLMEQALGVLEAKLGSEHPRTGDARESLAAIRAAREAGQD